MGKAASTHDTHMLYESVCLLTGKAFSQSTVESIILVPSPLFFLSKPISTWMWTPMLGNSGTQEEKEMPLGWTLPAF